VKCWLCSGERPGCKCMAEDLDELVDGEQGRPVDAGLWTEDTASVYAQDDWLSTDSALRGSHGQLPREGEPIPARQAMEWQVSPFHETIAARDAQESVDALLRRVIRSPSHAPSVPQFSWSWGQADANPIEDLRNALSALSGRPRPDDEVVVVGGPCHGAAISLPPGRTHMRVPEESARSIWDTGTRPEAVGPVVLYEIHQVGGRRYAVAPGWEVIEVGCRTIITDERWVRGGASAENPIRRAVLADQRREVERLVALGSFPLTGTEITTRHDEPRCWTEIVASSYVALAPPSPF